MRPTRIDTGWPATETALRCTDICMADAASSAPCTEPNVAMTPSPVVSQKLRQQLCDAAIGLAMGGNARTGMEDTLMLRRGVPAESNAQLVERLAAVARSLEREPASVTEVEERLALPRRASVV